jgi:hypothetical protein
MSTQRSRAAHRRTIVAAIAVVLLSGAAPPNVSVATPRAGCPDFVAPRFGRTVPTPASVLGVRIGERELRVKEIYGYLEAVDAASDRVRQGTYGTTLLGADLRYVVVGEPAAITPDALEDNARLIRRIQDPGTADATVRRLARRARPFLYIAGNVHGSEESGADAATRLIYHLADRQDCAAMRILRRAIVVVLPVQNPDGRRLDFRRNAYGFDMNRDGLVRSQAEIAGRWEVMRRFPPQLFVDAHEFGYARSFFPPNDDPIYHEVGTGALRQINAWYGEALADLFGERGWRYFNAGGYDLFAPIYGDTGPVLAFQAAGLTLETYNGADIRLRVRKNFDQFWTLLQVGGRRAIASLVAQHEAFRDALRQGRRGVLEPNGVFQPGSRLRVQVPRTRVRNYFLEPGGSRWALGRVLDLLRSADVDVYRLRAPLTVPDYRPYAGADGPRRLPAGTYWIPTAQPQKHWIQTLLNHDTYVPVAQTYDITGWSLPLLADLRGGASGRVIDPNARPIHDPARPPWRLDASDRRVALFELTPGVYAFEGTNQLRWLMDDVWRVPYEVLTTEDIRAGGLEGVDVLVGASGGSIASIDRLGPAGVRALRRWVGDGGHYVGYRYGGALLPAKIGITGARVIDSPTGIDEGALVRIELEPGPLRRGVGPDAWAMFDDDDVFLATPETVAASYPPGPRFDASGLVRGLGPLPGSAAIIDEAFRRGRVTVFPFDVNFRAMTWGTQRILWNAVYGPVPRDLERSTPAALAVARRVAAAIGDDVPRADRSRGRVVSRR